MATLYDLLGALPDDDADGLRAAFRKAAKASHPDVNPGDPEAAERFRRIVRANAILSDEQQRAAYDQLLEVARRQQRQAPKRSNFSGAIRRLAADADRECCCLRSARRGLPSVQARRRAVHRFGAGDRYVQHVQARTRTGAHRDRIIGRTRPNRATRPARRRGDRYEVRREPTRRRSAGQTRRHCTCGDYRHRSCKRPCFLGSRVRHQGRQILLRTGHFGVSQRGSVHCARQFRPGNRQGSWFIGFLHQSRHCLPSPGRPEARIVRRRRGQAHR